MNYWITLARFVNKLRKWNRDRKIGKQEGYARIPKPRPETAIWVEDADRPGEYFLVTFYPMNACEREGILTIYPISPWLYKTEILSFYKESTVLFRGNQNVRYCSYYYNHPHTGEQYQITLQDAKTHLHNWIRTGGQGWDLPSIGPQVGLGPIVLTVFLFEKPKRQLGR